MLDAGVRTLRIDYSPDGATWTELGTTSMDPAEASADYTGSMLDMAGFEAKYVLLTALNNHGANCTGLAEVKFNLSETSTSAEETYVSSLIDIAPNPADQYVEISIGDIKTQNLSYQLVDASGRVLSRDVLKIQVARDGLTLNTSQLPDGHYPLHVTTDEGVAAKQIIVHHTR